MCLIEIVELHHEIDEHRIFVKRWIPLDAESEIPVVLFHDSLGCVALWRDFPLLLAQTLNRPVIAYDRAGYGQSSAVMQAQPSTFIEDEAKAFFPRLKQSLGLTQYLALGHSVGGGMALLLAAYDDACVGVISIAAQAFVEARTLQGIRDARVMFSKPGQMQRLEKWHDAKASWVLTSWVENWLSPAFTDWSLVSTIRGVTCPALVMHGDNDEYGSCDFPHSIADNVSGDVVIHIIENCGHTPHKECQEEVMSQIQTFCQQQLGLRVLCDEEAHEKEGTVL